MARKNSFRAAISDYNAVAEQKENSIGKRIALARKEHNMTLVEWGAFLSNYGINISDSALSKWEKGQSIPTAYQLLALCHACGIEDVLSFFSGSELPALNEEGRRKVTEYRADLIATGKYKPSSTGTKLRYIEMPISTLAVSAGTGAFLDEGNFEMVQFPDASVPDGADFGLRVSGDSMEPVYHDGQIVWVQKTEKIRDGEVGVFVYDGEGYLKVYGEQAPDADHIEDFTDSYGAIHPQIVMISYNQAYEPRKVSPQAEFQIVGRVL